MHELKAPPVAPVWWRAEPKPGTRGIYCIAPVRVHTQRWFEARQRAAIKFGIDPCDLNVTDEGPEGGIA